MQSLAAAAGNIILATTKLVVQPLEHCLSGRLLELNPLGDFHALCFSTKLRFLVAYIVLWLAQPGQTCMQSLADAAPVA